MIPILLIVNIGLFIIGVASVNASVWIRVSVNDGQSVLTSPSLYSFKLANSVHGMWESHSYLLAIIIACFSASSQACIASVSR